MVGPKVDSAYKNNARRWPAAAAAASDALPLRLARTYTPRPWVSPSEGGGHHLGFAGLFFLTIFKIQKRNETLPDSQISRKKGQEMRLKRRCS